MPSTSKRKWLGLGRSHRRYGWPPSPRLELSRRHQIVAIEPCFYSLHRIAPLRDRLGGAVDGNFERRSASAGRSGSIFCTSWNLSMSPWKLWSRLSCNSRAMRVRSVTRSSSRMSN